MLSPSSERALLAEAASTSRPRAWKLWAMRAQVEERPAAGGDLARARDVYAAACKACPHAAPLWLGAARCEVLSFGLRGGAGRARAALERGRAAVHRALQAAVAAAGGAAAARAAAALAAGAGGTLSTFSVGGPGGAGGAASALPGGAVSVLPGMRDVAGLAAAAAATSSGAAASGILTHGGAGGGGVVGGIDANGAFSSSAPSSASASHSGAFPDSDASGERASPEAALDLAALFLAGVRVEDAAAWRVAQGDREEPESRVDDRHRHPAGADGSGEADAASASASDPASEGGPALSAPDAARLVRAAGGLWPPGEERQGALEASVPVSSLLPSGATLRTLREASWTFGDATSPPRRFPASPAGDALLARGLQALPASGPLLAEWLRRAPRQARKGRAADALRRADADADVVMAVAELFGAERKADKARLWLERAVAANPKLGDAWAKLVLLERETHGKTVEARNGRDKKKRAAAAVAGTGTHGNGGGDGDGDLEAAPDHGETALARQEACERAAPNRGERWLAAAKRPVPLRSAAGGAKDAQGAADVAAETALVPWGRARETRAVLEETIQAVQKSREFA